MTPAGRTPGHTPGPWRVETRGNIDGLVVGADGSGVACASWRKDDAGRVEFNANLALIASAPDLLSERDALRAALENIRDMAADGEDATKDPMFAEIERYARAALARGEGGAA